MRINEARALAKEDIEKELEESYREAMNIRFRLSTRQLNDTSQASKVRKKIARIKTVLREREILGKQK